MRPPFQTLYESLIWFGLVSFFVYLVSILKRGENYYLGIVVLPVVFSAIFYAFFYLKPHPEPLRPALDSRWFFWHAVTAFGSYAVLVNNFACELCWWLTDKVEERNYLRNFSYKISLYGFLMLAFAIVSGAVWAEQAWGRYWSWDPKETWALITWSIYAGYIHQSLIARNARSVSVLAMLGFISMVVTFIGVNWLARILGIPSLHTYAM